MVTIRGAYRDHVRVKFATSLPSRAKQSFKDEVDVNYIMAKYAKTGVFPVSKRAASFLDVPDGVFDLQSAMTVVETAREAFADMPAVLRKKFANDPLQFVNFARDPRNADELRKLGLLRPKASEAAAPPVSGGPGAQPPVAAQAPPQPAPAAAVPVSS